MKSHDTVNKLYKLGRVLSQIAFTLAVIGFFACIAGYISLLIGRDSIAVIGSIKVHGASLDTLGLNVKSIARRCREVLRFVPEKRWKRHLRSVTSETL